MAVCVNKGDHMKMTQWFVTMMFVLVVSSVFSQTRVETSPIYLLTRDDDQFAVLEVDPATSQETVLFTLGEEALAIEVLPEDEFNLLREYLSINFSSSDLETTRLYSHFNDLVVSPRGDKLLLQISYDRCIPPNSLECYGTTHLMVIDVETQQAEVIFRLGYHDIQYNFATSNFSHPETMITNISWLPNQEGIIAGIAYRRSQEDTLVMIPLHSESPLILGEGLIWTVSSHSNQLAVISYFNDERADIPNILKIIHFDSNTHAVTTDLYGIDHMYLSPYDTVAYISNGILFQIAFDTRIMMNGGEGRGLAFFNFTTQTWTMLVPDQGFYNFESYQNQVIMQGAEQQLYQAVWADDEIVITRITPHPVEDYALSHTGQILVHYADTGAYEILDLTGNTLQAVRLESPHTLGSSERSILQVDF
jgi:hypothetical protein